MISLPARPLLMDTEGMSVRAIAPFLLGVGATLTLIALYHCANLYLDEHVHDLRFANGAYETVNVSHPDQADYPYKELVRVLTKAANEDNTVIITEIHEAFAAPGSLLDLFFESFHAGENIEHLLNHLVLISMDQNAYDRCRSVHQNCYLLRTEGANYSNEKAFSSKDHFEMMWGRNKFQLTILELGFNFLFTDVDILWFRDPFRHIAQAAHFAIACEYFRGNSYGLDNLANGGFIYAKSCNKTIEMYKFWYESRERFAGRNEQYVLNKIKWEVVPQMKLQFQFFDTANMGTFCELSNDVNRICTLHSNCCTGLNNKIHDLRGSLDDWKNFTAKSAEQRKEAKFHWTVPGNCIN